jgi:hypothetical protein
MSKNIFSKNYFSEKCSDGKKFIPKQTKHQVGFFFFKKKNLFWALKPFIFESCWYFSWKPRILQLKRLNPRSATNQTVVPLSHATWPESDWLNGSDWDTSI